MAKIKYGYKNCIIDVDLEEITKLPSDENQILVLDESVYTKLKSKICLGSNVKINLHYPDTYEGNPVSTLCNPAVSFIPMSMITTEDFDLDFANVDTHTMGRVMVMTQKAYNAYLAYIIDQE